MEVQRHICAVRFRLVPDRGTARSFQAMCLCGYEGPVRETQNDANHDGVVHELGAARLIEGAPDGTTT